jgi:hypothetical protein
MIWLANTILVLHALLVLFIVGGLVAIWVGAAFRQGWVCNRAFRLTHLVAIGIVAALAALDVPCPLTVPQGFVQRWVSAWLYYDLPTWVFAIAYVAFLLVVVVTWWRIPPRA